MTSRLSGGGNAALLSVDVVAKVNALAVELGEGATEAVTEQQVGRGLSCWQTVEGDRLASDSDLATGR